MTRIAFVLSALFVATTAFAEPVPCETASSGGTTWAWCPSGLCYEVTGHDWTVTSDATEDDCLGNASMVDPGGDTPVLEEAESYYEDEVSYRDGEEPVLVDASGEELLEAAPAEVEAAPRR